MDNKDNFKEQVATTLNDKNAGRGSKKLRWLVVVIIAAAAFFIFKKDNKAVSIEYDTKDVSTGDLVISVTATGTLEPRNQVEVGSELSGIISDIKVDFNDRVKVGQLLARLDVSKLEAQVTQTKASLNSAQARELQAQATLDETTAKLAQLENVYKLSEGKVPSQTVLDQAKANRARAVADLASAKASVAEVQASLDINQTNLSKATIVSPVDGIVLSREIEVGQTVAASFEAPVLFKLAEDLSKMELHVDVDEADIGQVAVGQPATFTVYAYPDSQFPAQITQVRYAASSTDGVVTYETILSVENEKLLLRPGMTATAEIVVKKVQGALVVPSAALRFNPPDTSNERKGSFASSILPRPPMRGQERQQEVEITGRDNQKVWVMRDGIPVEVPVSIGVTDGVNTEILKGDIKPGDKVIVDIKAQMAGR